MYWRRFAVGPIPVDDAKEFELWVRQRWLEKEQLLEEYTRNGRFPADEGSDSESVLALNSSGGTKAAKGAGFIETEVKLKHWHEVGQIFVVLAVYALIANIGAKMWNVAVHGTMRGEG